MKLNCIVVEDDRIQRAINSKLINNHPNLHLVGDFSNAIEAKKCMSFHVVDLIFLDIEIPIVNGFVFLDSLKVKPQIIFISSKAEYAMKAFDYNATDYLQKPIAHDRFKIAVERALEFERLKNANHSDEEAHGDHIIIKSNLKKSKIYINKIKWIEAFGDYIKIFTDTGFNLVHSSMKAIESELSKDKFIRVHKSFIINKDKVDYLNRRFAEIGIAKIPISRNKKRDLVRALAITQ